MSRKYINFEHPRYGVVSLSVEMRTLSGELPSFTTLLFRRLDGSEMGEMDREGGGLLSHPSSEVDFFLRKTGNDLMDTDEVGYNILEDELTKICNKLYPGFFTVEVLPPAPTEQPRWTAPPYLPY